VANNWEIIDSDHNLGDRIISLDHLERYWVEEQVSGIWSGSIRDEGNVVSYKRGFPIGHNLELARVFIDSLEVDVVSSTVLLVGIYVSIPSLDSVIKTGTVVHDRDVEPDIVLVVAHGFGVGLLSVGVTALDSEFSRDRC
jgi:hypothetical protein